jgi:hypothetical protein
MAELGHGAGQGDPVEEFVVTGVLDLGQAQISPAVELVGLKLGQTSLVGLDIRV